MGGPRPCPTRLPTSTVQMLQRALTRAVGRRAGVRRWPAVAAPVPFQAALLEFGMVRLVFASALTWAAAQLAARLCPEFCAVRKRAQQPLCRLRSGSVSCRSVGLSSAD